MPLVCSGPSSCPVTRWPKQLQQLLLSRFRVVQRSHMINCTTASPADIELMQLTKVLSQMQAHCSRLPRDVIAYLRTAPPPSVALFDGSVRSEGTEALLGRLGEQECLRDCFNRGWPRTLACGPHGKSKPTKGQRRGGVKARKVKPKFEDTLSGNYWWARCSNFKEVAGMVLRAHGLNQSTPAFAALAGVQRSARQPTQANEPLVKRTQCWRTAA
mmetsp:Transcript_18757/g.47916  ORF Transcript_18757/g.47916 Transcript_18757/m.47916 type:complete len:215 (+) Transcript_18757:3-647(+)